MDKKSGAIEQRLIVLEEKLEYQDYTLEKLNEVMIFQQEQIDKLERKVVALHEKIEVNQLEVDKSGDEPLPPHY